MALQSSGQISFNNIKDEFGLPTDNKFGNYRVSQDVGELSNMPLDAGIPQSGQIKFSDFYGKKLNVVVDCYSADNGGNTEYRVNAKTDKWNSNLVTVIGGFKGKKQNGSKIIIHVNKKFGSSVNNNQNICALRTGSWGNAVEVQIDMGASGVISGAGGKGGDGDDGYGNVGPVRKGSSPSNGADKAVGSWNGGPGNSALGIQHSPTTVNVSKGIIQCGFGGGAAGRGSRSDNVSDRTACPGGGGGGAGLPGGTAGEGGQRRSHSEYEGSNDGGEVDTGGDGTAGSLNQGGDGGAGGNNDGESLGCRGGVGGDREQSPGDPDCSAGHGADGSGSWYHTNGTPGANGAAIRRVSGYNVTVNQSGSGIIAGSKTATGVA